MIKTILIYVVAALILFLLLIWILSGGIGKIIAGAESFMFSPISLLNASSTSLFSGLPGQPAFPQMPAIPGYTPSGDQGSSASQGGSEATTFGNPSPYAGEIVLQNGNASAPDPNLQYVVVEASLSLGSDVDITGWSLQSALSGVRAVIPAAADPFEQGVINTISDVELEPGSEVAVTTGASPVGVSFRENSCTGYLGQLQDFSPALPSQCPDPQDVIPDTPQDRAVYGDACINYIDGMSSCTFPENLPQTLSAECQAELGAAFSYNGCVHMYQGDASFEKSNWRVYLGSGVPLWQSPHDIVRLLDSEGRVVAVLSY